MQTETRFSEFSKALEGRWQPEWHQDRALAPVGKAMHDALNAITALMAQKVTLKSSGRYSNSGLHDKVRAIAARETVPLLKKAASVVESARNEWRGRRSTIALPKPDPANLTEALLRSEMRTWLRGMRSTQAAQFLMAEEADERLLHAVLEAPSPMSGITQELRNAVEEHSIKRKYGNQLAHMEVQQEGLTLAGSAVDIALYQLRQETQFSDEVTFDKWMRSVSPEEVPIAKTAEIDVNAIDTNIGKIVDEAFARALPKLYPDHEVNQSTR